VIIISIVSDYSAVGVYRFAKRLIEPVNYIISTFNPWLQSKLSQDDNTFNIKPFVTKFLLPLVSSVILFYVLFGKAAIRLIGSEDFIPSYVPMLILLTGYSCYLLTFWIRQYLLFNNLIKFHTYGRIIYSVAFILIALLTAPTFGYNGIALSLSISMILQKIYEYLIYKKKLTQ
jgi:O-antigen/teichoic acid export membrane protein